MQTMMVESKALKRMRKNGREYTYDYPVYGLLRLVFKMNNKVLVPILMHIGQAQKLHD